MASITIYKQHNGVWVTDWHNRTHCVRFNESDGKDFVTLGLLDHGAVRFEVSLRGEIIGAYHHTTDAPLTEITIPVGHALHREINIGKPIHENTLC